MPTAINCTTPDTIELIGVSPWDLMSDLDKVQTNVSDCHKDVYGFRPRFYTEEQWNSVEFLDAELDRIIAAGKASGVFY